MHSLQVPSHADQVPFSADGLHPAEGELSEAHNGLDDTEDWFDSAFSFGIDCSTVFRLQPVLHLGDGIGIPDQWSWFRKTFFEALVVLVTTTAYIRQ